MQQALKGVTTARMDGPFGVRGNEPGIIDKSGELQAVHDGDRTDRDADS